MKFEWSSYVFVYLITAVLGTYARYIFIKKYYKLDTSKLKDFGLFAGYYFAISAIYLGLNIPLLTLGANIVIIFGIALTYDRNIKKAAFASIQIIGLLLSIEIIVVLSTGYILVPKQILTENDYNSIFGPVVSSILFYIVVMMLRKVGSKKGIGNIPLNYWITIFIVPLSSLYFMVTLLQFEKLSPVRISVMASIVLLINFSIFKVYDLLSDYFQKKVEQEVENNLRDAYSMQLGLMKTMDENVASFQHDLNKHIYSLKTLAKSGELTRVESYLEDMSESTKAQRILSNSGNLIVDSIVNYELSKIEPTSVDLQLDINYLPENSRLEDFDLTILLSNLLNNAVEALRKQQLSKPDENKRLDIKIKVDKGILLLVIENTYDGIIKTNKSNKNNKINKANKNDVINTIDSSSLQTTKNDTKRHGYGLKNVERIIKKYQGEKVVGCDEQLFFVKVMLYV